MDTVALVSSIQLVHLNQQCSGEEADHALKLESKYSLQETYLVFETEKA